MVRRSALLAAPFTAAAAAGAVILALVVGGTWAACVLPGNLVTNGVDCIRFDPTTSTTITLYFDDANLIGGAGQYIQLGTLSQPGVNYPVEDIQVCGVHGLGITTGNCTAED